MKCENCGSETCDRVACERRLNEKLRAENRKLQEQLDALSAEYPDKPGTIQTFQRERLLNQLQELREAVRVVVAERDDALAVIERIRDTCEPEPVYGLDYIADRTVGRNQMCKEILKMFTPKRSEIT